MARKIPEIVDMDGERWETIRERAAEQTFQAEDYEAIRSLMDAYAYLFNALRDKNTSIARLKKQLFGASTEKTAAVIGVSPEPLPSPEGDAAEGTQEITSRPSPKGHGRNGVAAYTGAEKIPVPHESLKSGDDCPTCVEGTVYALPSPGVLIRIVGSPLLQATVYELEKLRCNLCGELFTAQAPEGIAADKYDVTAASMIGIMKYGSGLPFHRLEKLQDHLEVPLPAATQWEIVSEATKDMQPAYDELIRQAAQGELVQNDDTSVTILELMGKRAQRQALEEAFSDVPVNQDGSPRKELSTSGIVSTHAGHRMALFFSGLEHAGENLERVLEQRAAELPPPIQMCDALSRNIPGELRTIVANCMAHARRNFVDVHAHFPEECQQVLEALRIVYHNDAEARQQQLSPQERLALHQARSRVVMDELHEWLKKQFDDRRVETNSGLGEAISYMLRHWDKLTLFLRVAGAPLDNNVCERALKKAILHRKNALFFKTRNGARVGDLYMSLIYTCELNGANPFDYLTELQRHAAAVASHPADWMPWNYRQTMATALQAA